MEVTVKMELLEAVSNIYEHLFRWRRGRFYGEKLYKDLHNWSNSTVKDSSRTFRNKPCTYQLLHWCDDPAKGGFLSTNAHKSIYVISPEFNNNSQIIFRDNLIPMIRDKHVMILMASVTTGRTLNKAVESIQYYGGILQGASAIFSAMDSRDGVPIKSVFGKKDLPDYTYSDYRDCPLCKAGQKIDALVNTFGYSPMGWCSDRKLLRLMNTGFVKAGSLKWNAIRMRVLHGSIESIIEKEIDFTRFENR